MFSDIALGCGALSTTQVGLLRVISVSVVSDAFDNDSMHCSRVHACAWCVHACGTSQLCTGITRSKPQTPCHSRCIQDMFYYNLEADGSLYADRCTQSQCVHLNKNVVRGARNSGQSEQFTRKLTFRLRTRHAAAVRMTVVRYLIRFCTSTHMCTCHGECICKHCSYMQCTAVNLWRFEVASIIRPFANAFG